MTDGARDGWLDGLERSAAAYFQHEIDPGDGTGARQQPCGCPSEHRGVGVRTHRLRDQRGARLLLTSGGCRANSACAALPLGGAAGRGRRCDGINGFFYHFLDMRSARRVWNCEVSTIDSTILFAGALVAEQYFDRDTDEEREIRFLADALYRRADWMWALDNGPMVSLGWHPNRGFLTYRWDGYRRRCCSTSLGSDRHRIRFRLVLPRLDEILQWLRLYGNRFSTPVRSSSISSRHVLDRLPRHTGRLHAEARHRLLREQPARDVRPARIRGAQPTPFR